MEWPIHQGRAQVTSCRFHLVLQLNISKWVLNFNMHFKGNQLVTNHSLYSVFLCALVERLESRFCQQTLYLFNYFLGILCLRRERDGKNQPWELTLAVVPGVRTRGQQPFQMERFSSQPHALLGSVFRVLSNLKWSKWWRSASCCYGEHIS
jgi:hypothetical protein